MTNDNTRHPEDCAHCAINRALDAFNEAHSPVDVYVLIDDLSAVMCELIAFLPDRNNRRQMIKNVVGGIPKRVSNFRAGGRYPGGLGQGEHLSMPSTSEH